MAREDNNNSLEKEVLGTVNNGKSDRTGALNDRKLDRTVNFSGRKIQNKYAILGDMIRTGADSEVKGAYIVLGQK